MGSGDGKATQQEEARHRQRSKEPAGKPDSQTNGFTARPVDQLHDQAPSSPWRDLDMSVVISILTPLLSWAFGREYMKNILVAIFLIYYLHQLIEGSCTRGSVEFTNL
jgi:hypothetical protein